MNIDNREIRSFRLRSRIKDLKNFFFQEKTIGIFIFSDSLTPIDRAFLREQLLLRKMHIVFYPKTLFQFLFKDLKNKELDNILQGDVFLIRKFDNKSFEEVDLKFLLNQSNFFIRFLYMNQSIYRSPDIKNLSILLNQKKDLTQLPMFTFNFVWQYFLLNNLQYKHSNYIK